jgi:hypothetical protein
MEAAVDDLDEVNTERTLLVNRKIKQQRLSDHIVQVRSAVKGIFGAVGRGSLRVFLWRKHSRSFHEIVFVILVAALIIIVLQFSVNSVRAIMLQMAGSYVNCLKSKL